ncbi:SH3 domain-containing protein [Oleiagrimonas sp. C23AA]|uniref:SH3 domain-containing protein n=1 Tax=Oleiagrimonas sp. C23AA TaxID=2719047 RepID=UPI00141F417D|nr:SH3 domain-containing protein [Oleiagrimonas sp. C23AA]NII09574.1 SH3 domain-containing protein [Oleiagrimonas sp. C23AA]
MKPWLPVVALGLSSLMAVPAMAADPAYVTADLTLRAGPDIGYPRITVLPEGSEVMIQGCLDDWSWCDVIAGPDRGWVAGAYLESEYQDQPVYVESYGPRIGIPIVSFVLGAYWGSHYRNRSWYHERDRYRRAPPRHSAPRAPHRRPPPIHRQPRHDDSHRGDVRRTPERRGDGDRRTPTVRYQHPPGHSSTPTHSYRTPAHETQRRVPDRWQHTPSPRVPAQSRTPDRGTRVESGHHGTVQTHVPPRVEYGGKTSTHGRSGQASSHHDSKRNAHGHGDHSQDDSHRDHGH